MTTLILVTSFNFKTEKGKGREAPFSFFGFKSVMIPYRLGVSGNARLRANP